MPAGQRSLNPRQAAHNLRCNSAGWHSSDGFADFERNRRLPCLGTGASGEGASRFALWVGARQDYDRKSDRANVRHWRPETWMPQRPIIGDQA